ncbi:hypothetical protein [Leifsonia sp. EB34]|uniref:hypothetical protein n=1 Tax=Leifsonia sp. EB34 TaxID=3156303 RepID=UPI00351796F1
MNTILIPLLQGAGPVALAVVSFALAFTWTSLIEPVMRLRSERGRLAGFSAVGALLLLAASIVYIVPGVLLRDDFGTVVGAPLAVTWVILAIALGVRALFQTGLARAVSGMFSIVTVFGAVAGILVALSWHHPISATVLPTGAFVLVVGAIAGIVAWARAGGDELPAVA